MRKTMELPYSAFYHLLACARYDEETGKAAGVEEALWDVRALQRRWCNPRPGRAQDGHERRPAVARATLATQEL